MVKTMSVYRLKSKRHATYITALRISYHFSASHTDNFPIITAQKKNNYSINLPFPMQSPDSLVHPDKNTLPITRHTTVINVHTYITVTSAL